jgi:hypothetical protein
MYILRSEYETPVVILHNMQNTSGDILLEMFQVLKKDNFQLILSKLIFLLH